MPRTRHLTAVPPAPKQKNSSKLNVRGPGRCGVCSHHVDKQGHADWCTAEETAG